MIHTDQGYLQYDASTGLYNYHYYLTDHLGNVRAVLKRAGSSTSIEQQVDYYPFGMHKPLASTGINRYLYNRKELQGELGYYEYGARQYDPSIGRWNVVNPMAENHYGFSPYASPGLQLGVFVLHQ